jgi:hypothetical protein
VPIVIEVFAVSAPDVIDNGAVFKSVNPVFHPRPCCESGVIEMLSDDVVGAMHVLSLEISRRYRLLIAVSVEEVKMFHECDNTLR